MTTVQETHHAYSWDIKARVVRQRNALLALISRIAVDRDGVAITMAEILEITAQTVGVHRVSAWRRDDEHQSMRCIDSFEREAARHAESLTALPPFDVWSMIDVPVYLNGKEAGLVRLEHAAGPREWQEDEKAFAMAIARLISLARAL